MLTRFQIFLDFDEASLIRPNLTSFHLVLSGQLPLCSPLPAAADSLQGPCPVSLGWLHCEPSAHRFLRVAWSKSWGSIQLASVCICCTTLTWPGSTEPFIYLLLPSWIIFHRTSSDFDYVKSSVPSIFHFDL